MKIYESGMGGLPSLIEVTVEQAIKVAINSSVDFYSKGTEAVAEKVEKQSELIGQLVNILINKNVLTVEDIADMLSYNHQIGE